MLKVFSNPDYGSLVAGVRDSDNTIGFMAKKLVDILFPYGGMEVEETVNHYVKPKDQYWFSAKNGMSVLMITADGARAITTPEEDDIGTDFELYIRGLGEWVEQIIGELEEIRQERIKKEEQEKAMENKNLQVFTNEQFGQLRTIVEGDKVLYCASDIAKALGYVNAPDAVAKHCRGSIAKRDTPINCVTPKGAHYIQYKALSYITEGDVYRLITHSKLPAAVQFEKWVFDEVLPTIRKHGAYMTPDTLDKIKKSPEFAYILAKQLIVETDRRKELEAENESLMEDNEHKQSVIDGLTDNISLAELRQRINQIVRYHTAPCDIPERWNLLYDEFERKYRINLSVRFKRNRNFVNPPAKNYLDYVDRVLGMTFQLYEVACKLYETSYDALMVSWGKVIGKVQ